MRGDRYGGGARRRPAHRRATLPDGGVARLRALPLHLRHRRPYGVIVHGLPEPHQDRGAAPERLNRLMNEHAVGVVPSTGPEAFGIVGLGPQAAGCAVVASEAGGLPEAVGDGALLVEPGDVEALADALERALTDAALRADLAARGRENAQRFTAEAMGDRYAEMLADSTLW